MFKFIQNIGDYFSGNYFDEDFTSKVFSKTGYSSDDIKDFNKKISPLKDRYFRYKQLFIEGKLRTRDKIFETHCFHTDLLNALGYNGPKNNYNDLFHLSEEDVIPVRHILHRGDQIHLMIMEMQALIKEDENEPDGLFEQSYNVEDETQTNPPQRYHRLQWEKVFKVPDDVKISPTVINKIISELFLIEPHLRPKYILLLAGNVAFLLEQEKWFRGSYLRFDIEELFSEATANRTANYYALFYFLVGKETLSPDSNIVLLDQLDEDSHKSAYEVTKDLKEGIIYAVEALANEALFYRKNILGEVFDETVDQFEQEIKDDCLTIIYRLLFIFYAESRPDLDILPINDPIYSKGYSLEILRDLEQVPLYSETSFNGYFFHESLNKLFSLLSSGYREKENGQNKSFKVRLIDSPLFDNKRLHHLHKLKFRNKVWQDIICRLSLSKKQKGKSRGRITYANLGINQLGSAYESLLAYRGFYAEQDYIEVHKADKPEEGTYLVPRSRRDDFEENEILKNEDGYDIVLKKGSFVYRLSGRDRQKSASYYTPEVLTQCVVKYTLKPILEKLDRKEIKASELLELKLLEPAMGASAFQNEMINQLAEAYLNYRQDELNKKVPPDHYREELQKVKAYIATNNTYGVDLNPTAIELGKLSLWLNVIHHEMETPFFSNRLAIGNAVVGAWLNVYKEKEISEEYEIIKDANGKNKKVLIKKEWWNKAPRQLEFKPSSDYDRIRHGRKQDEFYHFLLFDKNMVPSSGIGLLKEGNETSIKRVTERRKNWCKPLSKTEIEQIKRICDKIDELLIEYYRFQKTINLQTSGKHNIFGAFRTNEQGYLEMRTYDDKEKLADQRNRHNAPYFKLKMIMDYWCSLWFWDVRQAVNLPDRQQYWQDLGLILELDINKAVEGIIERRGQQKLFETDVQLSMPILPGQSKEQERLFTGAAVEFTQPKDLFDNNDRIQIVSNLSDLYKFFHPQLEFIEVFWERGGFDLIVGNPPWIKVTFEEADIIVEKYPEIAIRNLTAPQIKSLNGELLKNTVIRNVFIEEVLDNESSSIFLNSAQCYPLLLGQQTNLYKCILSNGLKLVNRNGYIGLLHPEGVYDDPNGGEFRRVLFRQLLFHFQFRNSLMLFSEIRDQKIYSINVYKGATSDPDFISINNLLHPSTIEQCFIPTSNIQCPKLKVYDKSKKKYVWDLRGHYSRKIKFRQEELLLTANLFENSDDWSATKLPTVHSESIIDAIRKLSLVTNRVRDFKSFITEGWHETNDVNNNSIIRQTGFPDYDNYQMVYSGPHLFTGTTFYKTPKKICSEKGHYDVIDLTEINESFIPRSNYNVKDIKYLREIKGIKSTPWVNEFRLAFRKMLNHTADRTLNGGIIPPKTSHINGVISIQLETNSLLLELYALTSSIWLDFYVKSTGSSNLTDNKISYFPLGLNPQYLPYIKSRSMLLSCITNHYRELWESQYCPEFNNDTWSINDERLPSFSHLTMNWTHSFPLKNDFSRRWALIEIDILIGMALSMSLSDLIMIYSIQFPKWNEYEMENYYDRKGRIVFTTNNQGLVGIGVDSSVWEDIQNLKLGETYTHTITKSELYNGRQITYYAPFDRCDRIEDYKVAWKHFEQLFNKDLG